MAPAASKRHRVAGARLRRGPYRGAARQAAGRGGRYSAWRIKLNARLGKRSKRRGERSKTQYIGSVEPQTTTVVEGMCAPRFPPPPAPRSGNISPCRAAQPGGGNLENRIPRGGRKASRRTGDHIRDTIRAPERRPSDERRVEARRGRPRGGRARGSFHQDVVTRTMDPIGVSRTGRALTT